MPLIARGAVMTTRPEPPGLRAALLMLAVVLMLGLTLAPQLLRQADGRADTLAALWLCWAMCAGFVRGVGFVPASRPLRWLLGAPACGVALALAAWRVL